MSQSQDDYNEILEWLKNEGNLPAFLKDFHDQKEIFKGMHELYADKFKEMVNIPSWIDCHIYVIDFFLWYMGSRGYTLQKSRKKLNFLEFHKPKSVRDMIMNSLNNSGGNNET